MYKSIHLLAPLTSLPNKKVKQIKKIPNKYKGLASLYQNSMFTKDIVIKATKLTRILMI